MVLVIAAALSLLYSLMAIASPVAATQGDPHKATICHATSSETNPYVSITVDYSAIDGDKKNDHTHHDRDGVWYPGAKADGFDWGDIIPPVDGVTAGINWTAEGQTIYTNGCKAGEGNALCLPASNFTDAELRDMLLAEGSDVDGGHDAAGSSATSWDAVIEVPAELCDVQVSFSSYSLPGGFIHPFDEQILFDNVTGTYAGGSSNPVAVDLPECGWQVDLYIGPVIATLDAAVGHPGSKLMDYAFNEVGPDCGNEPPPPPPPGDEGETCPAGTTLLVTFSFDGSWTPNGGDAHGVTVAGDGGSASFMSQEKISALVVTAGVTRVITLDPRETFGTIDPDNYEVFEGASMTALGFCTGPHSTPPSGASVSIELTKTAECATVDNGMATVTGTIEVFNHSRKTARITSALDTILGPGDVPMGGDSVASLLGTALAPDETATADYAVTFDPSDVTTFDNIVQVTIERADTGEARHKIYSARASFELCETPEQPPEQPPGGGGEQPGEKPGEGTLGGNPLPDTAMTGSSVVTLPAMLVALLMLGGLGIAGVAVRQEVRRRR